jgi:hypothetical protein
MANTVEQPIEINKELLYPLAAMVVTTLFIMLAERNISTPMELLQPHDPAVLLALFVDMVAAGFLNAEMLANWRHPSALMFRHQAIDNNLR